MSVLVDETEFKTEVSKLEEAGPYVNLANFFVKLCETQWARSVNLKPYVAHVHAKKLGININLRKAKSIPLLPLYQEEKKSILALSRETYCGKPTESVNPNKAHYDRMRKIFPDKFSQAVSAAEKGSLRAHIALHCLDCSGNSMTNVKHCTVQDCVMWKIRPFQDKNPVVL